MIGRAFQQEQTYSRMALLQAATEFHDALERERPLLPYHYSFEITEGPLAGSSGSGGAGGLLIGGRTYTIWGGPGVCYLDERGVGPDGWGVVVNKIDVRAQKHVATDNCGAIKIRRRKLKVTLFDTIPPLVSFLRGSKDEVLRVLATEKDPSLMDLVRLVADGGGADDWAGEQLLAMGEEGKVALLTKLGDPRAKKHYYTIAQLLLTLFPSPESRQAVEQLIEREPNEDRKGLYVVWLTTTQEGAG
jgi:hypothetical protein